MCLVLGDQVRSILMKFQTTSALFLIFLIPLTTCKKKETPRIAYVIGDNLIVYSKPSRFSSPLTFYFRNSTIELLESEIPDESSKELPKFYRISVNGTDGFVSYHDERERKDFVNFVDNKEPENGIVSASNLRLRKSPTLTAEVITLLPKGTEIEIISVSPNSVTIDGIIDHWVQVKTKEGNIGFCFAGYIDRKSKPSDENSSEVNSKKIIGYIKVVSEAPVYKLYPTEDSPASSKNDQVLGTYKNSLYLLPKVNEFAKVELQAGEKTKFYKVERKVAEGDGCCSAAAGWISEDQVEFISDIFSHTLKSISDPTERELFKVVNSSVGENLNVELSKIKLISKNANNNSIRYYLVKAVIGDGVGDGFTGNKEKFELVVKKVDSSFSVLADDSELASDDYGQYGDLNLVDFNKDGTPEIIATSGQRSGSIYRVFQISENLGIVKTLEISTEEYRKPNYSSVKFEPPYITAEEDIPGTESQSGYPDFKTKKVRWKFRNGTFEKVNI